MRLRPRKRNNGRFLWGAIALRKRREFACLEFFRSVRVLALRIDNSPTVHSQGKDGRERSRKVPKQVALGNEHEELGSGNVSPGKPPVGAKPGSVAG